MYDCLGIKVLPWKLCQSKNGVCDESPPKRWTVAETFAWRLSLYSKWKWASLSMLYFHTGGRFTKDCLLLSINRWKIHIANSTSGHQIATMFWTWHGSTAPVPWAKLCSDLFIRMRMRAKRNTHRIWIANFSNHFLHFCKNRGVPFLAAKLRNKTSVTPIHSAVIGSRFDWIWTQFPP